MSRAENTPFTTEHVEWSAFKWFVYANTCHRFFFLFIHFKIENLTKSEVFMIFFHFFLILFPMFPRHTFMMVIAVNTVMTLMVNMYAVTGRSNYRGNNRCFRRNHTRVCIYRPSNRCSMIRFMNNHMMRTVRNITSAMNHRRPHYMTRT